MSLTLYAHPFAAYCWKTLIALYENATPFTYRLVENAAGWAELESLWPIKKFPLLRDGDATIVESSIIVEYLMRRYPGTTRMIPVNDDAALTNARDFPVPKRHQGVRIELRNRSFRKGKSHEPSFYAWNRLGKEHLFGS